MTITQRKQLEHRRIARAFASDHQRNGDDHKGTGTLGLFAIVLVCVIVGALWAVTR